MSMLPVIDVQGANGRDQVKEALWGLVAPLPLPARQRRSWFIFGGPLVWFIVVWFVLFAFGLWMLYLVGIVAVRVFVVLATLAGWGIFSTIGVIQRRLDT
jgi:hypothetical protein